MRRRIIDLYLVSVTQEAKDGKLESRLRKVPSYVVTMNPNKYRVDVLSMPMSPPKAKRRVFGLSFPVGQQNQHLEVRTESNQPERCLWFWWAGGHYRRI